MEKLKLIVLNDNEGSEGFKNDWGWSIFIDSGKKILFDADTEKEIIEFNSKKVNIDLNKIDFAFLSHYHNDHFGGFEYFSNFKRIKVFVPERDEILKRWNLEAIQIKDFTKIDENIYSTGPINSVFIKEQALVLIHNGLKILFVGCSHPGIDNISKIVYDKFGEIYLTIGGFHNPSVSQVDYLAKYSKYIAPAHCSGYAKQYIFKNYREKFVKVKTGSQIYLPFEDFE